MDKENQKIEVVFSQNTIWKPHYKFKSIKAGVKVCPYCKRKLELHYSLVPISMKSSAKIYGMYCSYCDCLYVTNKAAIIKLLKDKKEVEGFTLDGIELSRYTEIKKEAEKKEESKRKEIELKRRAKFAYQTAYNKMRSIQSAIILIHVKYSSISTSYVYIVKEEIDANPENGIFFYKSVEAREFLSSALEPLKSEYGRYNGKQYHVERYSFRDKQLEKDLSPLFPHNIEIRKDGGYGSSIKNRYFEIVDLFVYSPYYDRYEIITGTHDKLENVYFIDIAKYRKFLRENGKPPITIWVGGRDFTTLNAESILRVYGYTVNKTDDLDLQKRQELLAEIVDAEILSVSSVISYLDFFISSHSSDIYALARFKWEEDKEFIESYKVNPKRFLIAKFK